MQNRELALYTVCELCDKTDEPVYMNAMLVFENGDVKLVAYCPDCGLITVVDSPLTEF